jgi:hypothetical protein
MKSVPATPTRKRLRVRRSWAVTAAAVLVASLVGPELAWQANAADQTSGTQSAPATDAGQATPGPTVTVGPEESANPTDSPTATAPADHAKAATDETEADDVASTSAADEDDPSPEATVGPQAANFTCTPGYTYIVGDHGALTQVSPNGVVTRMAPDKIDGAGINVNGLGITKGGTEAYAFERPTSREAKIWSYSPSAAIWTNTGLDFKLDGAGKSDVIPNGFKGYLLGGAMDPIDGRYVIGGYDYDGGAPVPDKRSFMFWSIDVAAGSIEYMGSVDTPTDSYQLAGDFAFDGQGNLTVLAGNTKNRSGYLISVSRANYLAAHGGEMLSSRGGKIDLVNDANGVAFDANGKIYASGSKSVLSADLPTGSNLQTIVNGTLPVASRDMATCSYPPTVELRKDVLSRWHDTDQFGLELKSGSFALGSTTTSGTSTGMQDETVGPLGVTRGISIDLAETGEAGATLANYDSSWRCVADGSKLVANGPGTNGRFTFPAAGDHVVCTITNTAKPKSTLTVKKNFTDRVRSGDQVALSASDSGTSLGPAVTTSGSATGVQDKDFGPVDIELGSDHSYSVSEASAGGLEFERYTTTYTCKDTVSGHGDFSKSGTITSTGSSREATIGAIEAAADKKPRAVVCTFTNTPAKAQLTLIKKVENRHGGTGAAEDWDQLLVAQVQGEDAVKFDSSETQAVEPGEYDLSEEQLEGYEQTGLVCEGAELSGKTVSVEAGDKVACTFTNADQPGSVSWGKDDGHDHVLAGSEWLLTGPGGAQVAVQDCEAEQASGCDGSDTDPAPGKFQVADLSWGDYTLVETRAPAGFKLDPTEHAFTIDAGRLGHDFGAAFKNDRADSPELPLTGGRGTDAFLMVGGLILLGGGAAGTWHVLRRRSRRS